MEIEKPVDPSEVAALDADRIVGESGYNKKFPILIREVFPQIVFGVLHCLINHLLSTGNRRVALFKSLLPGRQVCPVKVTSPGQLQDVADQQSKGIDLLTELPAIIIGISPSAFKPVSNTLSGMRSESYIGMISHKSFDMASIPGDRLWGNTETLMYLCTISSKLAILGRFHEYYNSKVCSSMLENIFSTYGVIRHYMCRRHKSFCEPST